MSACGREGGAGGGARGGRFTGPGDGAVSVVERGEQRSEVLHGLVDRAAVYPTVQILAGTRDPDLKVDDASHAVRDAWRDLVDPVVVADDGGAVHAGVTWSFTSPWPLAPSP